MSDDMKKVKVTLVKSPIGYTKNQRATAESLRLRKLNSSAVHTVTPQIKGMLNTISHLITVEEVTE